MLCKFIIVLTYVLCATFCRAVTSATRGPKLSKYDRSSLMLSSTFCQLGWIGVRSGLSRYSWRRWIRNPPENVVVWQADTIDNDVAIMSRCFVEICIVVHVQCIVYTRNIQTMHSRYRWNVQLTLIQMTTYSCLEIYHLCNSSLMQSFALSLAEFPIGDVIASCRLQKLPYVLG